ncbi:hypothetical protein TGAMA5MH_05248 [Trichoderma gamsii]|uniref:Uncharacterized protein n=1 Tax=Trichoderma gamsii TaxID=398673 RepID=A0A2K0TAG2_9HYPO|nr:hypothetical protein TGAMA5MH_05248 [Trichoderma gamsii]
MSLSRAFTTRKLKLGSDADGKNPQRSHTLRHKISAPVQLVHTTNMLSYNAPDLPRVPGRNNSSDLPRVPTRINSSKSLTDSDSVETTESTPPTSPDVAQGERSPSPKPNHLSGYFKPANARPAAAAPAEPEPTPAPMIPQRSPTHTKKNSVDAVARSRSITRISRDSELSAASRSLQGLSSRSPSVSTNSSAPSSAHSSMHSSVHNSSISSRLAKQPLAPAFPLAPAPTTVSAAPTAPAASSAQLSNATRRHVTKDSNPFGAELAQVTELAEEFSSRSQREQMEEDVAYMRSNNLVRLRTDDYLSMVQSLSSIFFSEPSHPAPKAAAPLWI